MAEQAGGGDPGRVRGAADADPDHRLKITSWSELRAHLAAPGKRETYLRLLERFGVDTEVPGLSVLGDRAGMIIFEQPGCYLTPGDLMRARLLERLVQRREFAVEISGVQTLDHDRFTSDGEKGVFLDFALHPRLGPARLLSAQYVKKHQHQTYASLRIGNGPFQRIRSIWDYSLRMIEAAAVSPARFQAVVEEFRAGAEIPGACDLLPAAAGAAEIRRIGEDLAECHLEAAFKTLWPARTHLRRNIAWEAYWRGVNGEFMELPFGSASPLLEKFTLAIRDPIRLGIALHDSLGAEPDEPVAVAGMPGEREIFRLLHFDRQSESFFIARGDGSRQSVEWDALVEAARAGRGARPAGVLLYMIMAAFGIYLLVDYGDSVQPFQETVCNLHEREVGLKFPWVTFAPSGGLESTGNSLIEVFRPGFVSRTVDALSGFLDR